jgi:hypothetical protein
VNKIAEPDSQGCLLVVTSYADLAGVIEPIVVIAATRIASSPMLGDFIEIRYVSSGPRPAEPEHRGGAISRLVVDLTCPAAGAAENYFALVVIDESAASVSELLADCVADQVIARLGTKTCGFATADDRGPRAGQARAASEAQRPDIVLPTPDRWTKKTLTDALCRYAHQILTDVAAGGRPGLTPAQLASIRAEDDRIPVPHQEIAADDLVLDLRPAATTQDQAGEGQGEQAPGGGGQQPDAQPSQRFSWPPIPRAVTTAVGNPWAVARRRLAAQLPRPQLPQPQPAAEQPVTERPVTGSPRAALLFMSLFGGSGAGQQDDWRRARSVLLAVDERIAGTPALGYRVRAFCTTDEIPHSELRPAGQLSKRDLRRPDRIADFGPLLDTVLTTLTRDLRTILRSAVITARPAVILFPVSAPLADAVSMRTYAELTEQALVLWVVSEPVSQLISPDFGIGGTRTLVDHPDVSEEIADLLVAHANVRAAGEAQARAQFT